VDENMLKDADNQISILKGKRESTVKFIENKGNKFSLWGWVLKEVYLSQDDKIFGFF